MRINKQNHVNLKKKVIDFLKENKDKVLNISEISRGVDRAPPTITKVVEELEQEKKVTIMNKKSMRLVKLL
jgi:predicted transcriptional regulator with HTH domain